MNRNMIFCVTLPLALAVTGCGDSGSGGSADGETEGISSLSNTGDGDGDPTGDGDLPTGDGDLPTGDGDPSDEEMSCGDVSIVPTYTPPNVMLLVDASGSMVSNSWDHDLDPDTDPETRWKTLHRVVTTVLEEFGPAMRAGIQRFPSADAQAIYGAQACIVSPTPEVNVALDNGDAILAAIPGPDAAVHGGTPATAGMISVTNHLSTQPAEYSRYVLLISDGAANCTRSAQTNHALMEVYDETWAPTVEAARLQHDITTFVVGIDIENELPPNIVDGNPYVNPYEALNDVAIAGGVPRPGNEKFYNSTNQEELLSALAEIMDTITECIIDLSETDAGAPDPKQIDYVKFTVGDQEVPFLPDLADCETMDGWAWLEYGVVVTFCGSFCDDFKGGSAVFDGVYGCPISG
jgi:hypothetical protein